MAVSVCFANAPIVTLVLLVALTRCDALHSDIPFGFSDNAVLMCIRGTVQQLTAVLQTRAIAPGVFASTPMRHRHDTERLSDESEPICIASDEQNCELNACFPSTLGAPTTENERAFLGLAARVHKCGRLTGVKACNERGASWQCAWDFERGFCHVDAALYVKLALACKGSKVETLLLCSSARSVLACSLTPGCTLLATDTEPVCAPEWLVADARAFSSSAEFVQDFVRRFWDGKDDLWGACPGAELVLRIFSACPLHAPDALCPLQTCEPRQGEGLQGGVSVTCVPRLDGVNVVAQSLLQGSSWAHRVLLAHDTCTRGSVFSSDGVSVCASARFVCDHHALQEAILQNFNLEQDEAHEQGRGTPAASNLAQYHSQLHQMMTR